MLIYIDCIYMNQPWQILIYQDCDSCCRGFEPHQSPQIKQQLSLASQERGFLFLAHVCSVYAVRHGSLLS